MDALRPGHGHRSSSDRLLNNYLDSQKSLATSLLTLLSHSHSSTSSLLAYVTSSPGVLLPVRRAVRHAAFEGPLSPSLLENPAGSTVGSQLDTGTPGWGAYVSSLEQFRKDLKQIHLLEEEMGRVKRDREILVTRLIKTTKSRPTKSDIKDIATSYARPEGSIMSSQASTYSLSSDVSATGKETKRASKLADAQAELLGCEEHLRGLEVRIEGERNKVMYRGLEERFRAMEVVGQMWLAQSRRGLEDLEKLPELPINAYEIDSNGSLAPSQSASQIGYEEPGQSPKRPFARQMDGLHGPGSITGDSIAEEEENGSSDEEPRGNLVMHENLQASRVVPNGFAHHSAAPHTSSPLAAGTGGPRPVSYAGGYDPNISPGRSGGARRAASDIGARAYSPVTGRSPLRQTISHENPPRRAASDTSSVRSKKKRGFFASIARFFRGPSKRTHPTGRSGRDSPPYGSGGARVGGPWQTRTESNIKRASTIGRTLRSGGESSSDEDMGNFVAVSNTRNRSNSWSVENVGRGPPPAPAVKRAASVKTKPTPSNARSATPSTVRALSPPGIKAPTVVTSVSRSNTVKSTNTVKSAATSKSTATAKTVTSTGTAKQRTRKNGSISRAAVGSRQAAEGRTIMSIVDMPAPHMPEVPKAPKSFVTPQLEIVKAPGSSIVPRDALPTLVLPSQIAAGTVPKAPIDDEIRPEHSISRSNSVRAIRSDPKRAVSPLPPSKTRSPPLKSALRPTSPTPSTAQPLPPPVVTTLYSISAPGPVQIPVEEPQPVHIPSRERPAVNKRASYASTTGDEASIYESAMEDEGAPNQGRSNESSDEESTELGGYEVVENARVSRRNEIAAVAEGRVLDVDNDDIKSDHTATGLTPREAPLPALPQGAGGDSESRVSRRKSVRMNVPESPENGRFDPTEYARAAEEEEARERESLREGANSPPLVRATDARWDTRIGRMREDSSDEDEEPADDDYTRARRGLLRNTGKWESVSEGGTGVKKGKKSGSVKRSSSRR